MNFTASMLASVEKPSKTTMKKQLFLTSIFLLSFSILVEAQFFGRNKPRYRNFDFKILQTEHFDIYYYLKNKDVVNRLGQWSEMWYDHHYQVFKDSIDFKNPLLFYNNHADFQQTNAISGAISPGTGGVTEAFKNRVVMPLTFTHQQTNHVLGHEMVHAFQFNNIVRGDSTSLGDLRNLPLWMSEGLAEYLSLGSEDSHTALWMRDAVANQDIPSLKALNGYKYFPYRYGHALWAYITSVYGDDIIGPLYNTTADRGIDVALDSLLDNHQTQLGNSWSAALNNHFIPLINDRDEMPSGKVLLSNDNSGKINVTPTISPNGKYFVFLTNRDVINTDYFLADARDGTIIKKLCSINKGGADHIDFLESSGAWSPDSKSFAYVVYEGGKNAMVIVDIESGKSGDPIFIKNVPAFTHPAWSPDGKTIVFTGLVEGQVDLFSHDIRSGRTSQLTDDVYSEVSAAFHPDGSQIVFSYDKRSFEGDSFDGMYSLDLALMDMENKEIQILDVFQGSDNISPVFSYDGQILFASDPDGFRDMYSYNLETATIHRLTNVKTGISGITKFAPCISASHKTDRVLSSVYYNMGYSIVRSDLDKLIANSYTIPAIDKIAARLPEVNPEKLRYVDNNLGKQSSYAFVSSDGFSPKRYRPAFKLDYLGGGAGVGVSNNTFSSNTSLQGGIQTLFSDILGNNQLFANVALNGDFLDFGAQTAYINRSHRLAYGFGLGHVPLRTGYQEFADDVVEIDGQSVDVIRRDINILRLFNESANAFVHFPFSTTLRAEAGVSGFYQHFRQDLTQEYYTLNSINELIFIGQERMRVDLPDRIQFNEFYTLARGWGGGINAALVGDNSTFGMTGPVDGHRFRISLESQFGIDNYVATLVDARKYFFFKPFTFALRLLNYNRFEAETNTVYPFYIGSIGFVRGYQDLTTDAFINPEINLDRMIGSKLGLLSTELRYPLLGPERLALIRSGFLFTDLILFAEAGLAFDAFDQISEGRLTQVISTDENGTILRDAAGFPIYENKVVRPLVASSAGFSVRINIANALVIEPYYARQLVQNGRWDLGFNLIPGW